MDKVAGPACGCHTSAYEPETPEERPDPNRFNRCTGCGKEIQTPVEMDYEYHGSHWHYQCMRQEEGVQPTALEVTQAMKDAVNTREEYHGILKDSGMRVKFVTGAVRDTNEGKGRFDLIPPYPHQQLAIHYENGAKKYADRNWEKGITLGRMLDSAERHINNFKRGMRDEPHLIAAIWNLYGLVHFIHEIEEGRLPESLDDNNYLQREKQE